MTCPFRWTHLWFPIWVVSANTMKKILGECMQDATVYSASGRIPCLNRVIQCSEISISLDWIDGVLKKSELWEFCIRWTALGSKCNFPSRILHQHISTLVLKSVQLILWSFLWKSLISFHFKNASSINWELLSWLLGNIYDVFFVSWEYLEVRDNSSFHLKKKRFIQIRTYLSSHHPLPTIHSSHKLVVSISHATWFLLQYRSKLLLWFFWRIFCRQIMRTQILFFILDVIPLLPKVIMKGWLVLVLVAFLVFNWYIKINQPSI